jgi:hypothetical protein
LKLSRILSIGVVCLCLVAAAPAPQRALRSGVPVPPASQSSGGDVERGRYLVERVLMCGECHSPRDERGVILAGQEYTGAAIPFRPPWANDWADRAPRNRGLPGYSRELAMRLLMAGAIDREDRQLRPPMPRYRMLPQDAADVVAFMSSLR